MGWLLIEFQIPTGDKIKKIINLSEVREILIQEKTIWIQYRDYNDEFPKDMIKKIRIIQEPIIYSTLIQSLRKNKKGDHENGGK